MNKLKNVACYEFCKENNALLAEFLKKSEDNKLNKFCDLNEYERLTKILPTHDQLKELLNDEEIIDITQSDIHSEAGSDLPELGSIHSQEIDSINTIDVPESSQSQRIMNETSIDDIAYAIKENLETEKCLSTNLIVSLNKSDSNLEDVFLRLANVLNFEEVLNFGLSLKLSLMCDDRIVWYYVKYLLLKQLTQEFSDQLQSIYNDLCQRYMIILIEETTSVILTTKEEYTKIFLQYLEGSVIEFKSKLFRNFIFNCNGLEENHILLIEALHNSADIDSLNKLVELMSISATSYATSKPFGKLVLNVIKVLGKNINTLERPMNQIIATHKSVWKGKIQKLYGENLQDSILMSQSFRY